MQDSGLPEGPKREEIAPGSNSVGAMTEEVLGGGLLKDDVGESAVGGLSETTDG